MNLTRWQHQMRKRLGKLSIMLAIFLIAGIIYFIITQFGIAIPCIFRRITGFLCPGCGISRMCISIIKLDFYSAFRYNQACFLIMPLLLSIFARRFYCYVRYGEAVNEKWMTVVSIIILVILIAFGILRNIPYFDFFRPL